MRLSEAINNFLEEAPYKEATKYLHRRYLLAFSNFLGEIDLELITMKDLLRFELDLRKTKTDFTVYHHLVSVKSFFKYYHNRYELDCIDSVKIVLPRVECGSYGQIPPEIIAKLLKSFNDDITGRRNHAIISTFYSTGMRVSELAALKISQISFDLGEAEIIGAKTYKPRKVFFTTQCLKSIKRYLDMRDDDIDLLFVAHDSSRFKRQRFAPHPLKTNFFRTVMPRWAKKAGLDIRLHPHALRKSCATTLYRSNDLLRVQKIMGHQRPETTANYAIVDNLKDFHNRNMGNNTELKFEIKKAGRMVLELTGFCLEGSNKVKKLNSAIAKAISEVLS